MPAGLLVRLRPIGPWRFGSGSGARTRMSGLYHSDSLYSAVTLVLGRLGMMEDWLASTSEAAGEPAVRFTSCFPWQEDTLYITPPRHLWPPQISANVRWKGASHVPVSLVASLLGGVRPDENEWRVDPLSRCLIRRETQVAPGPYRTAIRRRTATDRLTGWAGQPEQIACAEFGHASGLWFLVAFSGDESLRKWRTPVESALRLLCDSGFGGGRSHGWGRSNTPEITPGEIPSLLLDLPAPAAVAPPREGEEETEPVVEVETGYWLLSLFSPGCGDDIQWDRGHYTVVERSGRVESPAGSGEIKKTLRMISEGSVILSGQEPRGAAPNVAPDGFAHPVYRYGFPVSIPIPMRMAQ